QALGALTFAFNRRHRSESTCSEASIRGAGQSNWMRGSMRPKQAALTFLALILVPCFLPAQERLIKDPLLSWMNDIAQRQLQEREKEIDQIHRVAEADRRKQKVRAKLLEILGGLPDYKGPLNAKVTGKIEAEGYTIEKVLFQSLPNFYVTADLY